MIDDDNDDNDADDDDDNIADFDDDEGNDMIIVMMDDDTYDTYDNVILFILLIASKAFINSFAQVKGSSILSTDISKDCSQLHKRSLLYFNIQIYSYKIYSS